MLTAQKGPCTLGCIKGSVASRSGEVILPLQQLVWWKVYFPNREWLKLDDFNDHFQPKPFYISVIFSELPSVRNNQSSRVQSHFQKSDNQKIMWYKKHKKMQQEITRNVELVSLYQIINIRHMIIIRHMILFRKEGDLKYHPQSWTWELPESALCSASLFPFFTFTAAVRLICWGSPCSSDGQVSLGRTRNRLASLQGSASGGWTWEPWDAVQPCSCTLMQGSPCECSEESVSDTVHLALITQSRNV